MRAYHPPSRCVASPRRPAECRKETLDDGDDDEDDDDATSVDRKRKKRKKRKKKPPIGQYPFLRIAVPRPTVGGSPPQVGEREGEDGSWKREEKSGERGRNKREERLLRTQVSSSRASAVHTYVSLLFPSSSPVNAARRTTLFGESDG